MATAKWRGVRVDSSNAVATLWGVALSDAIVGVEVSAGSVELADSTVRRSVRAVLAHGETADLLVTRSTIEENTFGVDGYADSRVTVRDSILRNNRTAVYFDGLSLQLAGNQFEGNQQDVLTSSAGAITETGSSRSPGGRTGLAATASLSALGTTISSDITTDITWTPALNPILVTGQIHVQSGVTLTVEAGTIVQFQAGGGSGLYVDGRLVVNGSSTSPAYFTSSLDTDTVFGGFPLNLPPPSGPQKGDWDAIRFTPSSAAGSSLAYAIVRYSSSGILLEGLNVVTVANGAVYDNTIGITLSASSIIVW